jgi:hypothetical protein
MTTPVDSHVTDKLYVTPVSRHVLAMRCVIANLLILLVYLVGPAGFEPTTSTV